MKNTVVELRGGYGEGDYYFRVFTEDVGGERVREPRIQCWPGYAFVRIPTDVDPTEWKMRLATTVKKSLIEKTREMEKDMEGLTALIERESCTCSNA